ncbi:MAG: hypothetical protein ACOCSL_06110 [Thermoplasmatota archaeon]
MPMQEIDKNVKEFMEEHGVQGFLTLFFTNYFYKMTIDQIKSYINSDQPEDDLGYQYYLFDEEIGSYDEVKEFEGEIKEECRNMAERIVEEMENNCEEMDKIMKGETEELSISEEDFQTLLHNVFETLHEEIDIDQE